MPGRPPSYHRDKDEESSRPEPKPGTVSEVRSQVRDPERVSVFIDGDFALGLDRTVAETHGIARGKVLDADGLAEILVAEELAKATSIALNFLAVRPRAEGEIRRRLARNAFADATIAQVIDRLRDWRYVDDDDFARRWVDNRITHRPRGARMLAQELRAKGIDQETANNAIADAGLDEIAGALDIARKRFSQLGDLDPVVRERRLTGFLARRGYGFDIIRQVLTALGGPNPDDVEA